MMRVWMLILLRLTLSLNMKMTKRIEEEIIINLEVEEAEDPEVVKEAEEAEVVEEDTKMTEVIEMIEVVKEVDIETIEVATMMVMIDVLRETTLRQMMENGKMNLEKKLTTK